MWVLRLWAGGPTGPIGNARYAATVGADAASPIVRGVTTANGTLGLPLFDTTVKMTLRIDVGPAALPPVHPTHELVVDDPRVADPPDPQVRRTRVSSILWSPPPAPRIRRPGRARSTSSRSHSMRVPSLGCRPRRHPSPMPHLRRRRARSTPRTPHR